MENEITLRDQFAMSALNGFVSGESDFPKIHSVYAEHAYKLADAMLQARPAGIEEAQKTSSNTGRPKLLAIADRVDAAMAEGKLGDALVAIKELRKQLRAGA